MRQKKSKLRFIKIAIKLGFIALVIGTVSIGGVFAYYAKDLPSPASIRELQIAESTKIYDRTGTVLLYEIHGEQKRTIIPFHEIPRHVKNASITAEDDDFYNHFGVDFKGIARAAIMNVRGKTVLQGGSTITQQLIKNLFLTPERTFSRKIKELILTVEMEIKYSKDEILDFYLNAVPYGSNAYGVEAASQTLFHKHAKDVTLAEAALLASLPKAPTYYSPFGTHTDELKKRQEYILRRMRKFGSISEEEFTQAKEEPLHYTYEITGIKAPHFVMYVREQLEKEFGDRQLKNSGLAIITTLDWELQEEAEKTIKEWAGKNEKRFGAKNAALVAIDPSSGEILAMVGSRDYFDKKIDGNVNVVTRPRQPGSSFKPFAYAKAFQMGYTLDTIVVDAETNFGVQGSKEYIPKNYDEKFRGPITLKEALAQSINVPAVKVLYLAGLSDTIHLARSLGITTLKQDPSHYGLSLVLGGGEVTLLEETAAYGVFSQEGIYREPNAILSIRTNDETPLFDFTPISKEVLSPNIARMITAILSDNALRAPIFGASSPLYLKGIPSAVKTGTAQEYRDAWTVGYTPKVTVGVWVGNNDSSKMKDADGVKAAAPIWHGFMENVYKLKQWEPTEFSTPEIQKTGTPVLDGSLGNPITIPVDVVSGKIATNYTPRELVEEKTFYELHSLLYYVKKDDPRGAPPQDPSTDPQFTLWEEGIRKWVEQHATSSVVYGLPPTEYDDVHTPENFPQISILSPKNGDIMNGQQHIQLTLEVKNNFPVQKVVFLFDERMESSISSISIQNREYSPYVALPSFFLDEKGPHKITVRAIDSVMNKGEVEVEILTL